MGAPRLTDDDCRRVADLYASVGPTKTALELGMSVKGLEYVIRVRCPRLGIPSPKAPPRPKMSEDERRRRKRESDRRYQPLANERRRRRKKLDVSQIDYDARRAIAELRKTVVKRGRMDSAGLLELIALGCKRAA